MGSRLYGAMTPTMKAVIKVFFWKIAKFVWNVFVEEEYIKQFKIVYRSFIKKLNSVYLYFKYMKYFEMWIWGRPVSSTIL